MQEAEGLMETCSHRGCDNATWYVDEMRRANSRAGGQGTKRKRQCEVVVVPPTCYNGSLPKRRGSLYYCEQHALRECECSVR